MNSERQVKGKLGHVVQIAVNVTLNLFIPLPLPQVPKRNTRVCMAKETCIKPSGQMML